MSSFTVGITSHNDARFIQSAVESASRADAIIVSDDASTDSSADIAENLGATVIRHSENSGSQIRGWNEFIERCETDWLILLSADDMLHSTTLAQVEAFGRDADWVWGNLDIIDEHGHQYEYYNYASHPRDVAGCIEYMKRTLTLYPTMIAGYRMSWIRDNGLRAEGFKRCPWAHDTPTGWKWVHANPRLKYTQLPFALYRQYQGNETSTADYPALYEEFSELIASTP